MNREGILNKEGAYVTDENGLHKRNDVKSVEQLRVENRIELLSTLLAKKEAEYEKFKDAENPKDKKVKRKISKKTNRRFPFPIYISISAIILLFIGILSNTPVMGIIAGMLFPVGGGLLLNRIYYKETLNNCIAAYRTKCSLEGEIFYLEKCLWYAKEDLKEINKRPRQDFQEEVIVDLEEYNREYSRKQDIRLNIIHLLESFREELIKNQEKGTLNEFLHQFGLTAKDFEENDEFIKTFTYQQKMRREL